MSTLLRTWRVHENMLTGPVFTTYISGFFPLYRVMTFFIYLTKIIYICIGSQLPRARLYVRIVCLVFVLEKMENMESNALNALTTLKIAVV